MRFRPLDHEVGRRLAGTGDLGPDAGIRRRQGAVGQARPVAPDRAVEDLGAGGVDVVSLLGDPLHVRPEAGLPGEVQGQVDPEPARHGERIDQVAKRASRALEGEVMALGQHPSRDGVGREADEPPGEARSAEAGAIDHQPGRGHAGFAAAHLHLDPRAVHPTGDGRAPQGDGGAGGLGVGRERLQESVAIEDACRGREERRRATHLGLQGAGLGRVEADQIGDPAGEGLSVQGVEALVLRFVGGHDELAQAAVRHRPASAVVVQRAVAGHREPRSQAARRVVDPGVDHLGAA